jgi:hypothetical protein
MPAPVRKPVYDLTLADFDAARVWEFALDEEGVAGQDEATVRPYEVAFPKMQEKTATLGGSGRCKDVRFSGRRAI